MEDMKRKVDITKTQNKLVCQIDAELIGLKKYFESIEEKDIIGPTPVFSEAIRRILAAHSLIQKAAAVLEFTRKAEENNDIPRLEKSDDGLEVKFV